MLESAGRLRRRVLGVAAGLALLMATPAAAAPDLVLPWPESGEAAGPAGERVTFDSSSPFALSNVGNGAGEEEAPATEAIGTLFLPPGASPAAPVPAVVLLHGASGVQSVREQIGRAHVCTPVTNVHLVCSLLLEKKKKHTR